jgi:hypothetical protein
MSCVGDDIVVRGPDTVDAGSSAEESDVEVIVVVIGRDSIWSDMLNSWVLWWCLSSLLRCRRIVLSVRFHISIVVSIVVVCDGGGFGTRTSSQRPPSYGGIEGILAVGSRDGDDRFGKSCLDRAKIRLGVGQCEWGWWTKDERRGRGWEEG